MVDCNHWRRPCNPNPAASWRSFLSLDMREEDKEKYQAAPISFTWEGGHLSSSQKMVDRTSWGFIYDIKEQGSMVGTSRFQI